VEPRLPAVGPVHDVVRVGEAKSAAGKAAAPVPRLERAANRGWNRAGLAAEAEAASTPAGCASRAGGTGRALRRGLPTGRTARFAPSHHRHSRVASQPPRTFRGKSRAVLQLAHPRLAVLPERLRLHVQDYLVARGPRARDRRARTTRFVARALAAPFAAAEPGRQRALRHQRQRVRPELRRLRPLPVVRSRGGEQRIARRLDRALEQGAHLRRHDALHDVHPLVVREDGEGPQPVAEPLRSRLVHAPERLPAAHQPLEARRRAGPGVLEQLGLVLGRRSPRERAHLAEGDPAARHRLGDQRQRLERTGGAHLLARRVAGDPDPPRQPLGTRAEALFGPVPVTVALRDRAQELARGRRDLAEQDGDPVHALVTRVGLAGGALVLAPIGFARPARLGRLTRLGPLGNLGLGDLCRSAAAARGDRLLLLDPSHPHPSSHPDGSQSPAPEKARRSTNIRAGSAALRDAPGERSWHAEASPGTSRLPSPADSSRGRRTCAQDRLYGAPPAACPKSCPCFDGTMCCRSRTTGHDTSQKAQSHPADGRLRHWLHHLSLS
jgi:hypothetical protein